MPENPDDLREMMSPLIEMRDVTAPRPAPPRVKAPVSMPMSGPAPLDPGSLPEISFGKPSPAAEHEPELEAEEIDLPPPVADRSACPTQVQLAEVLKRNGNDAERARVVEHMRGCNACRTDLARLRLRATPQAAPRVRFMDRRALMQLAGIAVVAVGVTALMRARSSRPPERPAAAPAPVSRPSAPVAAQLPVDIVAPENGARVSRPVSLTWHAVPSAMRYRVEILDHGNWSAYAVTTEDTTVTIPASRRLRPRVAYRWWVQATMPDGTHQRSAPRAIRIAP
ncbi:MAG: hypothetical protein ABJD07_14880 [Gemmatimonadaceae bacterium]